MHRSFSTQVQKTATKLISASLLVLLAVGPPLAAQRPPMPAQSNAAGPGYDDGSLPTPRLATPRPMPTSPIVEEAAPAPHEQPGGPVPLQQPRPFHEEAAPMPREQTQPPPRFWMPDSSRDLSLPDVGSLHRELDRLRMEREAMLAEEMDLITSKDLRSTKSNEVSLRMRVTELLAKVAQQTSKEKATASAPPPPPRPVKNGSANGRRQPAGRDGPSADGSHQPADGPHQPAVAGSSPSAPVQPSPPVKPPEVPKPSLAAKSETVTDVPVDPLALAQSLFRAGEHTAALNAYRKLDKEEQKPEDRIAIQYMMACCLRKLGKMDEASVLYREVANSPGNEFLMENAQWYLRTMKDRNELEAQLDELRQRRQAVKSRKP